MGFCPEPEQAPLISGMSPQEGELGKAKGLVLREPVLELLPVEAPLPHLLSQGSAARWGLSSSFLSLSAQCTVTGFL